MEHDGMKIHKTSKIVKVEGTKGSPLTIHTNKGDIIEVDALLWAIGREPSSQNIGLEELGIKLIQDGNIIVDEYQNSNVKGIASSGDVTGRWLLSPVANAAGRKLSNRLFGPAQFQEDKLNYENIPTVVFSYVQSTLLDCIYSRLPSHPPIGTVGLTEPQARDKYGDSVKICKPPRLISLRLLNNILDKTHFESLYFSMIEEKYKEPKI